MAGTVPEMAFWGSNQGNVFYLFLKGVAAPLNLFIISDFFSYLLLIHTVDKFMISKFEDDFDLLHTETYM